MEEIIELVIEIPEGIIDCRLELLDSDDTTAYSVTVLYPAMVNGFSRSEIYCYTMRQDNGAGAFHFEDEELHPKISKLEGQLSAAISKSGKNGR